MSSIAAEATPVQLVRLARVQLNEPRYAHLLAPPPEEIPRGKFLLWMSPSCWEEACHDCSGCLCACHDDRIVTGPEPERCKACGYLETAPGHKVTCGGEP